MENHIGSVVSDILLYTQTDKETGILLHNFKNKYFQKIETVTLRRGYKRGKIIILLIVKSEAFL